MFSHEETGIKNLNNHFLFLKKKAKYYSGSLYSWNLETHKKFKLRNVKSMKQNCSRINTHISSVVMCLLYLFHL